MLYNYYYIYNCYCMLKIKVVIFKLNKFIKICKKVYKIFRKFLEI